MGSHFKEQGAPDNTSDQEARPTKSTHAASKTDLYRERQRRQERQRKRQRRSNAVRTILLMLVALVLGVAIGVFVYPMIPFPGTQASLPGRTTVTESELDMPLGTYTYHGTTTTVTVREAIEESMSIDAARNEDGTYTIPSVDAVLSIARNHFLLLEADAKGIVASDEDALAYAQEVWGTDDLSIIAASYNMTEDQVRELMRRSAAIKKLRDEVVTTEPMAEPAQPAAPEAGSEDVPSAQYAEYVLALVGDEWDANANSWAREDGPFYEELKNYTISNDGATYSAAQAAYYVARTQYAAVEQQISAEWTTYVNQVLSEVTVELGTLVA